MSFVITIGTDNKSESTVFVTEAPETLEPNQYFVDEADLEEGKQTARWIKDGTSVRPMTDEEMAAELAELGANSAATANRATRDALLSATDWYVIKALESGGTVPANVATYRQALRDITEHTEWPLLDELDWPTL